MPSSPRAPWLVRLRPWVLLTVSAVMTFLGFAGFGLWPLAFVGIVPALFVLDPRASRGGFERPSGRGFFLRAWWFGYLAELGGFYWLVNTLTDFSGFPMPVCLLIASIFYLFQGLQFVVILWLWARARSRGFASTPALVAAYLASEAAFPMLFEHYYGASLHPVPVLMQVADLGGPMMCTALTMGSAGALYELVSARLDRRPWPRLWPALAGSYLLFALGYGAYRLHTEEARAAAAPHLTIGVVQANMGLFEKWQDPQLGVVRHVAATRALTAAEDPDLVVWPESAVTFFLPNGLRSLSQWPLGRRLGIDRLGVPIVFGGLRQVATEGGGHEDRNTAFLAGGDGAILGTYDKAYLLAFGEYLPFGDTFPQLYDLSPMSGRFRPGNDPSPVVLSARDGHEYRMSVLVCYEDIVSSYVRRAVDVGDPHVLLNVTNDSWFGDTQEPWVHLSLARFRAIEHRRSLIRATNSGVSAIVDATGQIVRQSALFEQQTLSASVPMLAGTTTLYGLVGPWPGLAGLLAILAMAFAPRRRSPD